MEGSVTPVRLLVCRSLCHSFHIKGVKLQFNAPFRVLVFLYLDFCLITNEMNSMSIITNIL